MGHPMFQPATQTVELPAFDINAHVLFQGDSITDAGRWINDEDPNHVFGQGYAYLIAARAGAYAPQANVLFTNRGISGNKVTDLAARWQVDALDLRPDVLSILVGVNDAQSVMGGSTGGVADAEFEAVYDRLILDARHAFPAIKLILCEPFTLAVGDKRERWTAWRGEMRRRQDTVLKLAERHHIPLVHFQQMFDDACIRIPAAHWIWDGVHPTYAGHQLMADEWVRTYNLAYGSRP